MKYLFFIFALSTAFAEQKIVINVPSYTLQLLEGEEEVFRCLVYVGKLSSPTRLGQGFVTDKRPEIQFRYQIGEKKGELIEYSLLEPEGILVPMPYEKMRALGLNIDGHLDQVIHATTHYWAMGTACSAGCIGLRIEDMERLYALVKEPLPSVLITYETHVGDRLYMDVYNLVADKSITYRRIDQSLKSAESAIKKGLAEGSYPLSEDGYFFEAADKDIEFQQKDIEGFVAGAGSLYRAFIREGLTAEQAGRIAKRIEDELDATQIWPEDRFRLQFENGLLTEFELKGRRQELSLGLEDLRVPLPSF